MLELSIKLYAGAYNLSAKKEKLLLLFSGIAVLVQLVLVFYLLFFKTFSAGIVVIFIINFTVPIYFLLSAWLDSRPQYRRHLTLTEDEIRYRNRFMKPEYEFEWNEVDTVHLENLKVVFTLKNEEEHSISFEQIQNDQVLSQVRERIEMMVAMKNVNFSCAMKTWNQCM